MQSERLPKDQAFELADLIAPFGCSLLYVEGSPGARFLLKKGSAHLATLQQSLADRKWRLLNVGGHVISAPYALVKGLHAVVVEQLRLGGRH